MNSFRNLAPWFALSLTALCVGCFSPVVSLGDDFASGAAITVAATIDAGPPGVVDAGLPPPPPDAGPGDAGPAQPDQLWPFDGSVDRWIAFDSSRPGPNRDVYALRLSDGTLKRLTTDISTDREPAFSPDGTRLAFSSDRVGSTMQIFVMDLATSATTQVTSGALSAEQPAWSPDGAQLAFHRGNAIRTIALDGGSERIVLGVIPGLGAIPAHPTYTADGLSIIADLWNQIYAVRLADLSTRVIVRNNTTQELNASVSPDGASVAFEIFCDGSQPLPGIRYVPISGNADGCRQSAQVTPFGHYSRNPSWGPGLILYEKNEYDREIMVIAPAGGVSYRLTPDGADSRNATWAPPGTTLP